MKSMCFLPVIASLALAAPVVQAQSVGNAGHGQQRFEQMDRMIDDARKLHGPARHARLMDHMRMMNEQMQEMHGMMGGPGAGSPPAAGRMGPGRMGSGQMGQGQMGQGQMPGAGPGTDRLQQRMDLMQCMMEQMQKQQELMLQDDR